MAERGHDVTIAALRGVTIETTELERLGVRIYSFAAGTRARKLRVFPVLARIARDADLVHCSTWDATLWGRLAALLGRRRTVITEHTPGREVQLSAGGSPRASWIAAHNRVLDPFTFATVVCARWQIPLLFEEGVRADAIVHIPNAVPLDDLEAGARIGATREELGIPSNAKVVIHAARVSAYKNQRLTLATVARLREMLGDVRAIIVGAGPDLEALEREAAQEGYEWARFLGRRGDVPALLSLADLAVIPSRAEAMPMVLIEAMALGVPVVGTDVGDIRHIVEESGSGIAVPVDDPDAFLAACHEILSDRGLSERLSESARAQSKNYDASVMTDRYAALFEAALDGHWPGGNRGSVVQSNGADPSHTTALRR
jgi:glycosyltransferase involved in cell wall biosynthesis